MDGRGHPFWKGRKGFSERKVRRAHTETKVERSSKVVWFERNAFNNNNTINLSQFLITKEGFMLLIILSNYT